LKNTTKRSASEYLAEGLMINPALVLGFVAENTREEYMEKK